MLSGNKLKEVRKIIQDVLRTHYSTLCILLSPSLKAIAIDMYSHGLISKTTKDTLNFNDLMREFMLGMSVIRDVQQLVKHCDLFLQTLDKQGGPYSHAASSIANEWSANIKERLNISIEFDVCVTRPGCHASKKNS